MQDNEFASTRNKTLRQVLQFPPTLCEFLDMSMRRLYNERLFNEEYNQIWFAKKFGKYFCVPKKI